jgi:hypothetical protein
LQQQLTSDQGDSLGTASTASIDGALNLETWGYGLVGFAARNAPHLIGVEKGTKPYKARSHGRYQSFFVTINNIAYG